MEVDNVEHVMEQARTYIQVTPTHNVLVVAEWKSANIALVEVDIMKLFIDNYTRKPPLLYKIWVNRTMKNL